MNYNLWRGIGLLGVLIISACSTLNPPKPGDTPAYRPISPVMPIPAADNHGAIFQASQGQGLFEDYKARRVGDLVTVVLNEKTDAKKSSATKTSKKSSNSTDLASPTVMGKSLPTNGLSVLTLDTTGTHSFDGSGDSSQSNQLSGEIAVMVAEVLPNGNLVIQGEKWLGINQGNEFVRIRGIIRPVDISAENQVQSTQIANAELYYGGTGALRDSNAQGWLSRFFNSPIWPI